MTQKVEKSKIDSSNDDKSIPINLRMFFLLFLLFTGLVAIFSAFLKIPITLNLYWITLTYHIFLTPILVYSIGIMFRPWLAFVICSLGVVLGETLYCIIFGCSGEMPFYLIFALVSRGGEVVLISLARKKNELLAMLIGGIYALLGFFIVYYIYYHLILYWSSAFIILYALVSALLDFIFIPFSYLLNIGIRKSLNIKYLDDLIFIS